MNFASVDLQPYFTGGPNETKIGLNALASRKKAQQGAMRGEGMALRGGILGMQQAAMGKMEAEQILAGAPSSGQAIAGGIGQMAKGLLGGLGGLGGGSGGAGGGALGGFGVTPATSGMDFSSAFADPNFMSSIGGFGG